MMSVVLMMTVFRIAVSRTDSIRVRDVVGLRPVHKRFRGGRIPPPKSPGRRLDQTGVNYLQTCDSFFELASGRKHLFGVPVDLDLGPYTGNAAVRPD